MRFDLSQKLVLGFTAAIAIGAGITPALHLLGACLVWVAVWRLRLSLTQRGNPLLAPRA